MDKIANQSTLNNLQWWWKSDFWHVWKFINFWVSLYKLCTHKFEWFILLTDPSWGRVRDLRVLKPLQHYQGYMLLAVEMVVFPTCFPISAKNFSLQSFCKGLARRITTKIIQETKNKRWQGLNTFWSHCMLLYMEEIVHETSQAALPLIYFKNIT